MKPKQVRPHTIGLILLYAIVYLLFTLTVTTNSNAEQFKITGKVQFIRYQQIPREYETYYNYNTRKNERRPIPLWITQIRDSLGKYQHPALEEVSSVFAILDEEFDFSNIPICAMVPPESWNGQTKDHWKAECKSALTDKNGSFEVTFSSFSSSYNVQIILSVNGAKEGQTLRICSPNDTMNLRKDIKGSTYHLINTDFLGNGDFKTHPVNIILYLTLNGELLQLQRQVDDLVSRIPSLRLTEILKQREDLLGDQTSFATRYPKSGAIIRDSILSIAEKSILGRADSAFDEKKFDSALTLYSELASLSPTSPESKVYSSKKELTLIALSKERKDDSLHAYCDSLIAIADALPTKSKSIKFLESKRKGNTNANPYWQEIEERIQLLKSEIETEKNEAEFNREQRADLSALKKFKVDPDVTLMDFFSNPFALKGKYIAIRCIVVKFETPTSAIMEADKRFYADFIVTPPKKFEALDLIVKVKGVTTLINAFGTPIKVPYVDVVHILNMPPDN